MVAIHAQSADLSVVAQPQVFLPLPVSQGTSAFGKTQGDWFLAGIQPKISVGAELFGFFRPAADFGYNVLWAKGLSQPMGLLQFGASLNGFIYPVSRIRVDLGAGMGYYVFSLNSFANSDAGTQFKNLYLSGELGVSVRAIPGLVIRVSGAYLNYLAVPPTGGDWESFLHGINVGLSVDLGIGALTSQTGSLRIQDKPAAPILPLFYESYKKTPLTTVTVSNTEQAEIRDVRVRFNAGTYASDTIECAVIPYLGRGESREVPLFADLSDRVLALTEATKIQGDLSVSYSLLDSPRVVHEPVELKYDHRNALVWKDQRAVASFISPTDPAVLEFSKFVAGMVRNRFRGELNKDLQFGLGVFEAMRLSGINVAPDSQTPYSSYHLAADKTDFVQYPYQTLSFKSGDSDDVAVLYACALSSVGVKAALIAAADEMLLAFDLDITEVTARANFAEPDTLIYRDGQAWLPVRVSLLREGFLRAWQAGAEKWRSMTGPQRDAAFFDIETAWKVFPPVGLPNIDARVAKPSEESLTLAFDNTMNRLVKREIDPKLNKILSEMPGGKGNAKQYNNIGILYAKYGMLDEAKAAFKQAGAEKYVPALVNLGNIALLEKQYEEAITIFDSILKIQPGNKTAMLGLAQARYEMNEFEESDKLISQVRLLDKDLAARFSYLSSTTEAGATRASAVATRDAMAWDAESE